MRFIKKHSALSELHSRVYHPSTVNLTYFWNFGVYATVCLIIQIITGIFLAMHYTAEINLAFDSVEHIMRDVNYGWLLRYIHANGASMFFIVVYIHTFRGLYYSSFVYPRQLLWCVGVIILLLMILTAFLGYVLPWGQMSFWGATVITNLVSAIPKVGSFIVTWLWGGPSISNATLNRFYSFHYLLPFIIAALVFIHILLLHEFGSNSATGFGLGVPLDFQPFYPFFLIKDLHGLVFFLIFFSVFVFFMPNALGHPDNYILANPLVTPAHIVPEWYFLPFYAILRAVPDKLGGVIAILASILVLLSLPFVLYPEVRSMAFRPFSKIFFWYIVCIALLLGWIGGKPVEYPFVIVGQFCSIMYFVYFLVISPIIIDLEHFFWDNDLYLSKFFNVNNLQNNDDIILSNTQNVQKILEKISLRSGTS
jgi:ubiquinol-cytochrome c reductase cytochrome b subunit